MRLLFSQLDKTLALFSVDVQQSNGVRLEAAEYQEEAQLQQEAQLQKGEAPGIVIPMWRTND